VKHTRARRRAFFLTLGGLWLAGAIVTIAWFRLAGSAAYPESPAALDGLTDSVRVEFDSLGIPTIRAASELDAWRALGYLHASDRLWQMEYFRRIAAGRLAEVFGSQALQADRFIRTLGMPEIARHAASGLAPGERAALASYAEGVNARLATGGSLPPEFRILRFRPEAWTPESSLMIGLVMNLDLSHWRRDLARHWGRSNLDPGRAAYLHPPYPTWGPATLDGLSEPPPGVVSGFETMAVASPAVPSRPGASRGRTRDTGGSWDPFDVLAAASIRSASNAWVVGSSRTASGNPIVANDMHLALRAPSIWYIASVHGSADDLHVAGFTLPGIPGVVVGFNRQIAWGATNGMVDDMDFFVEQLSDDETEYRDGAEWVALDVRVDSIHVRGEQPVLHTVRATRRGPLMSDVLEHVPDALSAMFLPARTGVGLDGVFALNHAGSVEEFHAAVGLFTQPHLNLVVGSTDGRIGYRLAGSVPIRHWDGALPISAEVAPDGWSGFWSSDAHPSATAPTRDFIATANNLQVKGLDGAIGADYPVPFRALRLTQALAVRRDWTIESTGALQRDVRSLLADRGIDRAIAAARRIGDEKTAELLSDWNRQVVVSSRAAPVFYTWFYGLRARVAADEWEAAPSRSFFPIAAMLRVLEEGDGNPWVDDVRTPEQESLARLEEDALRTALERTGGRTWGELHTERHVHPLGRISLLDRLFGFNVGPYPSEGGPNTLRPDSYQTWHALDPDGPVPPWSSEYGPSERMVTELTPDGPRGFVVIPTGQSGNPFSRHYDDMLPLWRSGRLVALPVDDGDASAVARLLVLRPAGP
jgi:penicillin amidase